MKKIIMLLVVFFSLTTYSQVQRCITDQLTNDLINSNYDAKLQIDALNDYLANKSTLRQSNSTIPTITIPVVINIVHENKALGVDENISDSQVLDQLVALNNNFSSYGITFCLATKMGQNSIPSVSGGIQYTPGIIHYNCVSSVVNHIANSNGQQQLILNTQDLPRSKYLRIWVVKNINGASSGILGYSMFPNVSPIFDGIVIRSDVFGNLNPNLLPNYNQGKVLVHEVGHYLGLYHTFQGGCTGMSSSDCLTSGDRVCDTPPVENQDFGCIAGTDTCIEPIGNLPDPINNFMGYGDNNCSTNFTLGQKNRMFDIVDSARNELVSTDNLIYTGVLCINPNTISAKFSASSYYSCLAGNSITFTPLLIDNSLTYSWNFGDLSSGTNNTSSLQLPIHVFSTANNSPYIVTLNVSNGTQTATFTTKIFITNCSPISGSESTWYFSGSNAMSFATGVPVISNKTFPNSPNTFFESCAQQNTSTGSVLFYTNGEYVWRDSSNMAFNSIPLFGDNSSKSGSLILPNPANVNQYYIFNIDAFAESGISGQGVNGLTYNIVTMSGNTPSMTSTNIPVTIPSGYLSGTNGAVIGGEGLTAMERCNGGYWIFTTLRKTSGNFIVIYSLTSSGLNVVNSGVQIPTTLRPDLDWASSIKLSPNGNKLLYVNYISFQNYKKSYLFDFNKYTGVLSLSPIELPACYGASFSPDSNLLYMGSAPNTNQTPETFYVYQYNLNSNNILNSRKIVGAEYGVLYDMQIAPDNKIYLINKGINKLGIIHNPNIVANQDYTNECNYTFNGVVLNNNCLPSLPNIINAKVTTAFPTVASITSTPISCFTYIFFPNACGTSYNWEIKNSSAVIINTTSGTQLTYTFPAVGTYTVNLKNTSNVIIATKIITIANPLAPSISGSSTICIVGNGIRRTNNSINLLQGETALWSITSGTGTIVGANNQASVEVSWVTAGTLSVTITNAGGCSITSNKIISNSSSIIPTFTQVAPICSGSIAPVLPTTSTNGVAGTWSPTTVSNTTTATYTFTPTTAFCATTATLQITVLPNNDPNCSSNCPANLTLSIPETNNSFTYNIANTIILNTNYSVDSGKDITTKAGTSIDFLPNTEIKLGATFEAKIEDCSVFKTVIEIDTKNNLLESIEINLKIYPNPSSSSIKVEVENTKLDTITIFSIEGKQIKNYTSINSDSTEIDVRQFVKGIYIVKILDTKGNVYVNKIIKE